MRGTRRSRSSEALKRILEKHPGIEKRFGKQSSWAQQMGTLGGGNHFIEVCLDEANRVWVMLHSGSRGIGNAIGTLLHRAGEEGRREEQRRTCRTAISPTSRKARSTSTTTSTRSAGRRTTRAPTARR